MRIGCNNSYELIVEKALEETGMDYCKMISRDDVMFILYLSDEKRGAIFVDEDGKASFSYTIIDSVAGDKETISAILSQMNKKTPSYYLSLRKGGEIVSQYDFAISFDDTVTLQIKSAMEWFKNKNKLQKDIFLEKLSKK